MRATSLESFNLLKAKLGVMQQIVFKAIVDHPYCTDRELATFLGVLDPNVVRPRRKELLDEELIIDYGIRECSVTGKKAHIWALNYEAII